MSGTENQSPATDQQSRSDSNADAPTVLLVDNDGTRTALYQLWLEGLYDVAAVESLAALDGASEARPLVAFFGSDVSPDSVADAVARIRGRAPWCRVVVSAPDPDPPPLDADVFDVYLREPIFREELLRVIRRCYRQARYAATLRRYFRNSTRLATLDVKHSAADRATHEEYQRLSEELPALQSRVDALAADLDADDRRRVLTSLSTGASVPARESAQPTEKYRPDSCSACGRDWGVDHSDGGTGVVKLGAFAWECTWCGTVQSVPSPTDRRVARR